MDGGFVPSVENCERECFNNPECHWYTFDLVGQFCILTSDCVVKNSSNCYQGYSGGNPSKDIKSTASMI